MITLSSDFGWPYPAAMRGVIYQQTDARVVDVTHEFPRQDVRTAAFWLREILPYFPPAVHVVVVDPGVGTDRAALAVRAGDHVLVGPDNGVLLPVARELAGDREIEIFDVEYGDPDSVTFHGRDVFAPTGAAIHESELDRFEEGETFTGTDSSVDLTFPEPDVGDDEIHGEVMVVDDFGNVITNVPGEVLADCFGEHLEVNYERVPVARTYAAVDAGEHLVTVGSHGNVELAVNQGRGDRTFGLGAGDEVSIRR
ncbi:SAM-dependent chlorinase/fluorinase [Haloarculaceae archaeon H-GB1-1]|nr:SAM-dependent chlorinase/fluorinase [Haloarculaceae archaeon H-GB1-1]